MSKKKDSQIGGSANRRDLLKGAIIASSVPLVGCATTVPRSASQKDVMDLRGKPMDTVRVGVIGVGNRGTTLLRLLTYIDGLEVKAICDTSENALSRARELIAESGRPSPTYFSGGDEAYKNMLQRDDIDAVFVITPWKWHTPMALDVMRAGKHAFVEVPVGVTLDECWQLVEMSERMQVNCMMLENVCYGRSEMMVLNMVRDGLFGDLTHGEAAYIHDLRWQMKEINEGTGSWRTHWHTKRDGNLYPTHGLGPIAQYMNINRGDQFTHLTSMSSPALGRAAYAAREFPADHERNQLKYIVGDMNTSLIKTALGRSILVQHDTTTPRPYSRLNLIQGTNGAFAGFPSRIALESNPLDPENKDGFHHWDEDLDKWYAKYEHALWRKTRTEAEARGGHGGMDFVMLWRLVYCLRNGLPLDQNVYDAAAWSAVTPLSMQSVANKSASVDFPDFTRGVWKSAPELTIAL